MLTTIAKDLHSWKIEGTLAALFIRAFPFFVIICKRIMHANDEHMHLVLESKEVRVAKPSAKELHQPSANGCGGGRGLQRRRIE